MRLWGYGSSRISLSSADRTRSGCKVRRKAREILRTASGRSFQGSELRSMSEDTTGVRRSFCLALFDSMNQNEHDSRVEGIHGRLRHRDFPKLTRICKSCSCFHTWMASNPCIKPERLFPSLDSVDIRAAIRGGT